MAEGFLVGASGYIYDKDEANDYFKGQGPFTPIKLPEAPKP